MVCRLLRSLEGGQLPDDGGALTVDGIVYLSAARSFHRTNLPDLYAGLTKLLPDETVKQLDSVYKNPQATTRATMEALVQAFPSGRTVVLLDNFEDMLAVETGQIKDAELDDALRALLELPPHGLKIIITTRVAPGDLALVQPGLQRRLNLDTGLEHPYAENILRAMDADGKVGLRDAPEALLAKARERTRGYPRALEHLFGILSADRDTSLQRNPGQHPAVPAGAGRDGPGGRGVQPPRSDRAAGHAGARYLPLPGPPGCRGLPAAAPCAGHKQQPGS